MVARSLVVSAVGKISSVAFDNGYIVVSLGDMVVRHKVGARGGIPVAASRDLWRALQMWKRVGVIVSLSGRPGWAGWFDAVAVADASHGLSAGDLAWQDCLCREVLKELRGED